jgi:hypothetical protein
VIRFSEMTGFKYGAHRHEGGDLAHTDVSFEFNGEHYGCRFPGRLALGQLSEEEDRFLERRHARRPRLRSI